MRRFPSAIRDTIPLWLLPIAEIHSGPIHAAYNKQIGWSSDNHTLVVMYFDAAGIAIAWSNMCDPVTEIGTVADSIRLDWSFEPDPSLENPRRTKRTYRLVFPGIL